MKEYHNGKPLSNVTAAFGAEGEGFSSTHPTFLHEKVRSTLVCIIVTSNGDPNCFSFSKGFISQKCSMLDLQIWLTIYLLDS